MDFISYKWWAKYIYSITKKSLPKHPSVLELAAGNCSLANYLSKNYKNYFATDISFQMLNQKKNFLNKICCDMTALPVKGKFDLVFTAFDSVNYLLTQKDLLKHFKQVSSILTEEGIYTFDAALEKNSYKHQKTAEKSGKTKGYLFKRDSVFNPKTKIHKNIFTIIYPDGSLHKETHTQKIFSFDTFFELAEKSGLYVVNCYKAFSFTKGKADSDRVQFIMKRNS
jgi:SAM-dependent methyltransferase